MSKEGYIFFQLEDTYYALPVSIVRQVEMVEKITSVPTSPPYVLGVTSIRGQVLPVLDLRRRLGLPSRAADRRSRLLVVEWSARTVALLVDSATEFREVSLEALKEAPGAMTGELIDRILHLDDRTVLLLDLSLVLE